MCPVHSQFAAHLAARAPLSPAQKLFCGQNAATNRKHVVCLEQWAEIRLVGGRTVTELYPSNEELIERGKAMLPPPEFVSRQLNFPQGIPAEYEWVGVHDAEQRQRGGSGMQRMTADAWLALIEREATQGNGHLLPTPNSPRREKHALCDCPVCLTNVKILRHGMEESRE